VHSLCLAWAARRMKVKVIIILTSNYHNCFFTIFAESPTTTGASCIISTAALDPFSLIWAFVTCNEYTTHIYSKVHIWACAMYKNVFTVCKELSAINDPSLGIWKLIAILWQCTSSLVSFGTQVSESRIELLNFLPQPPSFSDLASAK